MVKIPMRDIPLIALLLVALIYMATSMYTNNTSILFQHSAMPTINSTVHNEIIEIIKRFEVEEVKVIDECVYIRGHVANLDVMNNVHVLLCGEKVYIFAEVQLRS